MTAFMCKTMGCERVCHPITFEGTGCDGAQTSHCVALAWLAISSVLIPILPMYEVTYLDTRKI